jgi:hypothetical protein
MFRSPPRVNRDNQPSCPHGCPMGFLSKILNRPKNEKPYLLIPVGYPTEGATVPRITKRPLPDVIEVMA